MDNFSVYVYLGIAVALVILISISGVFFLQKNLKNFLDKNLHYLVSFSAGVFCFLAWAMFETSQHILGNWKYAIASAVVGFSGIYLLMKFMPQIHEHHDSCCEHSHKEKIQAKKILWGDAFHNIGDGIILATGFLASFHLGVALTISIIIHEFLQEISEFFVLKEAGYSTKKAIIYNLLISLTIIIGVIIGVVFAEATILKGVIIGVGAGIFFNAVVSDLIPHSLKRGVAIKTKLIHLGLVIFGASSMFVVINLIEHSH